MINWDGIVYDVNKAMKDFSKLEVLTTSMQPIQPKLEFESIREKLIDARDRIFDEHNMDKENKLDYSFDLLFGIEVYEILNKEIGFTNRVATNDDIWRYISICVIPDIVHARWSFNDDHFYRVSKRIWLKTIWWYVHLSWRESTNITYEILKNNTTDTIVQLVERPGIGYYVELYREIMFQYINYEDKSRDLFRRVLKLNTARLITVSPELVEGGIPSYVDTLFKDANRK